jgi:hypothetical protein
MWIMRTFPELPAPFLAYSGRNSRHHFVAEDFVILQRTRAQENSIGNLVKLRVVAICLTHCAMARKIVHRSSCNCARIARLVLATNVCLSRDLRPSSPKIVFFIAQKKCAKTDF